VEGGPLSVNPVAQPDAVCLGDTVRLFALSGGGSGIYTYSWSSVPGGFTSSSASPLVVPTGTTVYNIIVDDGFNQRSGSTTATVYPLPDIHLGPSDSSVCIYDTVRLDAGNPGSTYQWSTGSTSRFLTASTTGIGYDEQTYSVVVTDQNGCRNTGKIVLLFTFDDCVGIDEHSRNSDFSVYPNPASESFRLQIKNAGSAMATAELINAVGTRFMSMSISRSDNPSMEKEFDVSGFPPGMYILLVRTDRFSGSVKLIIL
jgi:hypothetical protein